MNIYVNVNYLHTVDALNTVPIYVIQEEIYMKPKT